MVSNPTRHNKFLDIEAPVSHPAPKFLASVWEVDAARSMRKLFARF